MTASPVTAVLRIDGGRHIGLGHLRRCLSLSEALSERGVSCHFAVRGDESARDALGKRGLHASLVSDADDELETLRFIQQASARIVIVDSYFWGRAAFELLSREKVCMVAIDDLADRELPVDLIVNASAGAEALHYSCRPDTICLLGPEFALLRREFSQHCPRRFEKGLSRVLLTMGGSDPCNMTLPMLRWVTDAMEHVAVEVVVGPLFPDVQAIEDEARLLGKRVRLHLDPQDMSELMNCADVAISGGGQTTYELAAAGTPTIGIRVASNQTMNLENLESRGVLLWVGDVGEAGLRKSLISALLDLSHHPQKREDMSRAGRSLVDGYGCDRVAGAIREICGNKR